MNVLHVLSVIVRFVKFPSANLTLKFSRSQMDFQMFFEMCFLHKLFPARFTLKVAALVVGGPVPCVAAAMNKVPSAHIAIVYLLAHMTHHMRLEIVFIANEAAYFTRNGIVIFVNGFQMLVIAGLQNKRHRTYGTFQLLRLAMLLHVPLQLHIRLEIRVAYRASVHVNFDMLPDPFLILERFAALVALVLNVVRCPILPIQFGL